MERGRACACLPSAGRQDWLHAGTISATSLPLGGVHALLTMAKDLTPPGGFAMIEARDRMGTGSIAVELPAMTDSDV